VPTADGAAAADSAAAAGGATTAGSATGAGSTGRAGSAATAAAETSAAVLAFGFVVISMWITITHSAGFPNCFVLRRCCAATQITWNLWCNGSRTLWSRWSHIVQFVAFDNFDTRR